MPFSLNAWVAMVGRAGTGPRQLGSSAAVPGASSLSDGIKDSKQKLHTWMAWDEVLWNADSRCGDPHYVLQKRWLLGNLKIKTTRETFRMYWYHFLFFSPDTWHWAFSMLGHVLLMRTTIQWLASMETSFCWREIWLLSYDLHPDWAHTASLTQC